MYNVNNREMRLNDKGGLYMLYTIDEIKTKAIPIAQQYGIETLSLFGSYARGDADDKSDIDFLIQKGKMKGLLSYCGMVADFEEIFHCHVDVVIKNAIKDREFLEEIQKDEVMLYER